LWIARYGRAQLVHGGYKRVKKLVRGQLGRSRVQLLKCGNVSAQFLCVGHYAGVAQWPNDPKLSDRGARRGGCTVGGKAVAEAAAVTCGAVRCSAWLGRVRLRLGHVMKASESRSDTRHERRLTRQQPLRPT
jgi:hypothetical protein